MIRDVHPVLQALLAGFFTWSVTALGAAVVFVPIPRAHLRKFLGMSLGFAAGVMTAASFWSLLAQALEIAEEAAGKWSAVIVTFGFTLGVVFVFAIDRCIPASLFFPSTPSVSDVTQTVSPIITVSSISTMPIDVQAKLEEKRVNNSVGENASNSKLFKDHQNTSWRRIVLLIVAVTVHNVPEGAAVGIGFGSIDKSSNTTTNGFDKAFNLAIALGLQNFPEGLAVSIPLTGFGYSKQRAFIYGQLSGVVEPMSAVIGAWVVLLFESMLPYALSFAAGAMMFVVFDGILPEAQQHGNGKLVSFGAMIGFVLMMCLEVGLG